MKAAIFALLLAFVQCAPLAEVTDKVFFGDLLKLEAPVRLYEEIKDKAKQKFSTDNPMVPRSADGAEGKNAKKVKKKAKKGPKKKAG